MPDLKVLGLMLSRDSMPMLDHWLEAHASQFDAIFGMDGSSSAKQIEESRRCYEKHGVRYVHDKDAGVQGLSDRHEPGEPAPDQALRKPVFTRIQSFVRAEKDFECEYWVVLIHPDEFYKKPIRDLVREASRGGHEHVLVRNCHNMPHPSEYDAWVRTGDYRVFRHFYGPGWPESRMFRFSEEAEYVIGARGTLPAAGVKLRHGAPPTVYHYKIVPSSTSPQDPEPCRTWTGVSSHYPAGHTLTRLRDMFIEHPGQHYETDTLIEPPPR